MTGEKTQTVREDQQKIKIRRSSGKVQYVTPDELDRLNDARKHRDQMRHSHKSNPNRLFALIIGLIALVGAAFFGITVGR